jgi:MFS family permease
METTSSGIDFLPGTSYLTESDNHNETSHLLRQGDIVLSPQPTTSPNDPLNWSLPRKYWHAFLVCFVTGLTAATSNDAGSTQYGQNADLNISYNAMNTAAGVLFIGIGYWTLLMSPAAWLYGRRITYLVCMILGILGAIWLAQIKTTNDSVFNQLFVGASEACAEANVQLSLSDLFFQHQRGTVIGVYVLATSIGTYLAPLIGGYIADSNEGWRWVGWWSVIISCGTLVVLFFTLEETAFERPKMNQPDQITERELQPRKESNDPQTEKSALDRSPSDPSVLPSAEYYDKPKTYWQRIRLITPAPNLIGFGFKQYFMRLLHTLRIFSFPAVIYSGIQWGAQDAWLTFYLTLEEENWTSAPWNYSDVGSGIMNVPCLIGALIGCFYGGYLSDKFVYWRAKCRGGIREAEDRLWLIYACAIFSPAGMLLFGIGTAQSWSWHAPYVGLGLIGFGWGCAGDLSMSYLMDAYPEMVLEGMVGVAVINNTIGCIFTFATSPWLTASGTQNTMIAVGVLDFVFIMLTVPMMIWGKSARRWTRGRYEEFIRIRDSF